MIHDGLDRMARAIASTRPAVTVSPQPTATQEPTGASNSLLRGLRNGAWLDVQTFPPLRYAVEGLIPEGFSFVVGPPKVGKSWYVLDGALAVAAGGRALGTIRVPDPRPVLYLALEDGDRRMQDRCRKLLAPGESIPPMFDYLTHVEHGRVVETIEAWLMLHPDAALVLVDTLGKVMPPALNGESSYQRDYRVAARVKRIADDHPGLAIVVNHHDNKAMHEDFVHSVSGTNGLAGAADTIVLMKRSRFETDGLLMVTGRDVAEAEYAVRFADGYRWSLIGDSLRDANQRAGQVHATAGVGDRMAEVIALVTERGEARATEVADGLKDMNENKASVYLGRAVNSGRLRRVKRGVYAPLPPVGSVELLGQDRGLA